VTFKFNLRHYDLGYVCDCRVGGDITFNEGRGARGCLRPCNASAPWLVERRVNQLTLAWELVKGGQQEDCYDGPELRYVLQLREGTSGAYSSVYRGAAAQGFVTGLLAGQAYDARVSVTSVSRVGAGEAGGNKSFSTLDGLVYTSAEGDMVAAATVGGLYSR
jgi:hypothetical protein